MKVNKIQRMGADFDLFCLFGILFSLFGIATTWYYRIGIEKQLMASLILLTKY